MYVNGWLRMFALPMQASTATPENHRLEDDIVLLDEVVPVDKMEIEEYAKSLSWQLTRSDRRNAPVAPPSSTETGNITYHRRITFSTVRAVDLRQVEILCESVRALSIFFPPPSSTLFFFFLPARF